MYVSIILHLMVDVIPFHLPLGNNISHHITPKWLYHLPHIGNNISQKRGGITSAPVVITSATDILAITSAIQYLLVLQYVDITSATYTLA